MKTILSCWLQRQSLLNVLELCSCVCLCVCITAKVIMLSGLGKPNGLSVLLTHSKVIWLAKTRYTALPLYPTVCFDLSYSLFPFSFFLPFPSQRVFLTIPLHPFPLLSSHTINTHTLAQRTYLDLKRLGRGGHLIYLKLLTMAQN